MKRFVASLVVLCIVAVTQAAVTIHLKVDCRTGACSCAEGAETLYYDTQWYENASRIQIYDGSTKITEGTSGSIVWNPVTSSSHTLKLMAYNSSGTSVGQESVTRSFSHVEVVTTAAKGATCTEKGCTKGSYCSRCNAVLSTSKATAALGHVEVVTTAAKAATCTDNGCTKGSYCSRCNKVLATSKVLQNLGGHVSVEYKVAVEPTSGKAGSTAEIRCSRCNEVLQASAVIPALGYVRNVMARQLWPHNVVAVSFDVADDISEIMGANEKLEVSCSKSSTTYIAKHVIGDLSPTPGTHCVAWDLDADGCRMSGTPWPTFKVRDAAYTTWVNTSTESRYSASCGSAANLGYASIDAREARVNIDGVSVLVATNLHGGFRWQPRTKGAHTFMHIAGTNVWTRKVNVTALAYEEPTPNPSTAVDTNFTLSTTVRALTSSAKASGTIATAKVNSSYTGTWSATTSADWLTLTYATRNVGLPVIYTAAENLGVEDRTGYIYVSGHVFTVTQPGVGGSLDSNTAAFDANGGDGSFTVTVGAQSSWRARSNVDWISVATLCGTGETEVVYHVAPWNNVSTRSGTITAAGCTFTVNQTGRPMKLNATEVRKDYSAHDVVLTVDALSSTTWGIALDAPWVSIVDRGSGKGGGTVTLAINENPSFAPRTATALIGTETVKIVQTGRPTAALSFAISPAKTTASVKGANGVIAVEATPDLPWTAKSQASWLTIMPGFSSAAGNGNVVYTATPNPTMSSRSGKISVTPDSVTGLAGKTHTVTQPAATSMISADTHTFAVDGDSFAVDVTIDDVVAWTIVENVAWLSVDGATSRNGPGSVTIAVEPNMSINPREATLTIAGHTFHVVQRGRTITLEYGETVFPPDEFEEATIEVHPDGNVAWTATPSDATWISVWSDDGNVTYNPDGSVSGVGDATLKYMVTAYVGDGGVKTGWIQIGNEKVYVAQRAYDLNIVPTGVAVSGNAGAGSVAVPASVGDVWNAIATEPWIKLVGSYDEVTGNGTVNYTFTDNDTGETRTGKIVIAGEEYTITQAARRLVTITATVSGEGGMVSGGGTYTLGTSVTLKAVVNDDDHKFVRWERGGKTLSTVLSLKVTADVDQEIIAVFEKIKTYVVNDEEVKEGSTKSFTAPEPVVLGGTTQLVCRGSSAFPDKGTSFSMAITGDVAFEWDLWATNYWVDVAQSEGGMVSGAAGVRALPCWVEAGSEVSFTATPATGYSLMRWIVDAIVPIASSKVEMSLLDASGTLASTRVRGPLTIGAIFAVFNDTLATAADAPALTFRTGGDAEWTPVIDPMAATGYTSVRSGAIGAESETWLETTVEGTGTLYFNWRVDCEHDDGGDATWDRLAVFVNGVEKGRLDGVTDWQTVELPLTDAKSVIRWSFYRDDHDEPDPQFANCGWIDGLVVEVQDLGGVQLWENGPYWAECNVGATKPEEYGYYFWWGDTVGYKREGGTRNDWGYLGVTWVSSTGTRMSNSPFDSSACPTMDKSTSELQSASYIDSTGNLVAAHDAATAHLGAPWRMPTDTEMSALISNCDMTWTTQGGVCGRLVTGRGAYASKSIFLPAAGYGNDSSLYYPGSFGIYWSSTPYSDYSDSAWFLYFDSGNFNRNCGSRYYGQSVRPVRGFAK